MYTSHARFYQTVSIRSGNVTVRLLLTANKVSLSHLLSLVVSHEYKFTDKITFTVKWCEGRSHLFFTLTYTNTSMPMSVTHVHNHPHHLGSFVSVHDIPGIFIALHSQFVTCNSVIVAWFHILQRNQLTRVSQSIARRCRQ